MSFREVSEQIADVSAAAEQLSAGSEEVAAAVSGMAHIAGGVSEGSRMISTNTNSMREAIPQVSV
ncbi:hypothetical protein [Paenibacillus sp. PK3_47]|uniref:hypothetical protein n=1 Tax=Paenibacillus sp. PK3_47 TaxID=2072642 RepID=UPI00201DA82A|nr:hypothetical protein [Paenibacillus sp. PK3_47]